MKSIDELARAFAAGSLSSEGFIAAAVGQPVVKQNPSPHRERYGDWPLLVDGPLASLSDALSLSLITPALYDLTLRAMIRAGHEA